MSGAEQKAKKVNKKQSAKNELNTVDCYSEKCVEKGNRKQDVIIYIFQIESVPCVKKFR